MDDNMNFRILDVPTSSDKVYRDTLCMAYVCSVLDLPMSDFETGVKSTIGNEIEKEAFLQMMTSDLEVRIRRLLKSK